MNSLLASYSIYPVGTQVELDDASIATVLRSNGVDPLCRIVVWTLLDEIVDLRKSKRTVKGAGKVNV